jgi:hypothetical protein
VTLYVPDTVAPTAPDGGATTPPPIGAESRKRKSGAAVGVPVALVLLAGIIGVLWWIRREQVRKSRLPANGAAQQPNPMFVLNNGDMLVMSNQTQYRVPMAVDPNQPANNMDDYLVPVARNPEYRDAPPTVPPSTEDIDYAEVDDRQQGVAEARGVPRGEDGYVVDDFTPPNVGTVDYATYVSSSTDAAGENYAVGVNNAVYGDILPGVERVPAMYDVFLDVGKNGGDRSAV